MSRAEMLQRLLDTRGDGSKLCPRCQCCELVTEECEQCNEGLDGHDCGEDCCCCEFPEENLRCQFCNGRGYFEVCLGGCDAEGKHESAALEKLLAEARLKEAEWWMVRVDVAGIYGEGARGKEESERIAELRALAASGERKTEDPKCQKTQ